MPIIQNEQVQMQRVEQDLLRQFAEVPPAVVCRQVRTEAGAFEGARVRAFVPVLVQKNARTRLREALKTGAR